MGRSLIRLEEIASFVATSSSRIIPERVAVMLEENLIAGDDIAPSGELLSGLVNDLRGRLEERGIITAGPDAAAAAPSIEFSPKERRMLRSLGVLLHHLAQSHSSRGEDDEIIACFVEIERIAELTDDYRFRADLLEYRAGVTESRGDLMTGLALKRESHQLGLEHDDREIVIRTLLTQGQLLQYVGEFDESTAMLLDLLERVDSSEEETLMAAAARFTLAGTSLMYKELDRARGYIRDALDSIDLETNRWLTVQFFRILAETERYAQNYVAAYEAISSALEFGETFLRADLRAGVLATLCTILIDAEEQEEASEVADRIYAMHEAGEISEIPLMVQLFRAEEHSRNDERDAAERIYHDLLEQEHFDDQEPGTRIAILAGLGKHYTRHDAVTGGLEYLARAGAIAEEASLANHSANITLLHGEACRAGGEDEKAIARFREVLAHDPAKISADYIRKATAHLAEMLTSAGRTDEALPLIEQGFRMIHEQDRKKYHQRIAEISASLGVRTLGAQVRRFRERVNTLERELQQRSVELAESNTEVTALRKAFRKLEQQLLDDDVVGTDRWSEVQSAIAEISRAQESDLVAAPLLLHSVSDRFYRELRRRHDDLTPGDVRLAGLIRSGMDHQEICTILHISSAGLKKRRYRLRRRLDLTSEVRLEAYLQRFGMEHQET